MVKTWSASENIEIRFLVCGFDFKDVRLSQAVLHVAHPDIEFCYSLSPFHLIRES